MVVDVDIDIDAALWPFETVVYADECNTTLEDIRTAKPC